MVKSIRDSGDTPLFASAERALRRRVGRARLGFCADHRRRSRRDFVRAGGAPGRQRQLRVSGR